MAPGAAKGGGGGGGVAAKGGGRRKVAAKGEGEGAKLGLGGVGCMGFRPKWAPPLLVHLAGHKARAAWAGGPPPYFPQTLNYELNFESRIWLNLKLNKFRVPERYFLQ